MTDQFDDQHPVLVDESITEPRRVFLRGLAKWSQAVIGGVLLSTTMSPVVQASSSWINRRSGWDSGGGSWINRSGGGGWVNGGGWINGGGGWINRSGGGWVNRSGGGWVNRRGGGSWINR